MSKNEALAGIPRADGGVNVKNINGGPVAGYRNKIINGDFDIWQRGASQTGSGYLSDDRWQNLNAGSNKTHSLQGFALGQTDVPGNPTSFSRTVVASVAGAANFVNKIQRIENVRTLAGRKATVTFYAKADANRNMAFDMFQHFGSGGSPSAPVEAIGARLLALTAAWKKFSFTVDIPSVAGKTLGTNLDNSLAVRFWFDAGSSFNDRASALGQQSGTFDIAHVSVVEGDATAEDDPFSPRHIQQEVELCQRYFESGYYSIAGFANATSQATATVFFKVTKRAVPTRAVDLSIQAVNMSNPVVDAGNNSSFRVMTTISANASAFGQGGWIADAELA